jgi:glycine/D-amino acid oxidase-like deaminating enzyme
LSERRAAGSVVVVGAGAFGLAAALELRRRGHRVTVVDPGPVPHPHASSTDISKAVRMDYGRDGFYADLAAEALAGWRAWNRRWDRRIFHESGILLISRRLMAPGGFEHESYEAMLARRVPVERLNAEGIARRFPAWAGAGYVDGYFNPAAGWAESAVVVALLAAEARGTGVVVREGASCSRLAERGAAVCGVVLDGGEELEADHVIVCAGAFTLRLLPYLTPVMWPVGQAVVHFRPSDPRPWAGACFPVWCADISTTGWYGFPANHEGLVKIGHHGRGREMAPGEPLEPDAREIARAVDFVARDLPALAGSRPASGRICLYCDTFDGDFLIDHDPDRPGLIVAAGGSGHGFKFAPVLGPIVADVTERKPSRWAPRFAWRASGGRGTEHARHID